MIHTVESFRLAQATKMEADLPEEDLLNGVILEAVDLVIFFAIYLVNVARVRNKDLNNVVKTNTAVWPSA